MPVMSKTRVFRYNNRISLNTHMPELTPTQEQVLATWRAPMHATMERTKRWYMIGGGVTIALAIYGIVTGAWTFAVVILLCAAMYVFTHDHRFGDEAATITTGGVQIAQRFMRFEDMQGFWFLPTPGYTELHIVPTRRQPDMVIQTGTQDIQNLRQTLSERTTELTEKREHFLDAIIRICKL